MILHPYLFQWCLVGRAIFFKPTSLHMTEPTGTEHPSYGLYEPSCVTEAHG